MARIHPHLGAIRATGDAAIVDDRILVRTMWIPEYLTRNTVNMNHDFGFFVKRQVGTVSMMDNKWNGQEQQFTSATLSDNECGWMDE